MLREAELISQRRGSRRRRAAKHSLTSVSVTDIFYFPSRAHTHPPKRSWPRGEETNTSVTCVHCPQHTQKNTFSNFWEWKIRKICKINSPRTKKRLHRWDRCHISVCFGRRKSILLEFTPERIKTCAAPSMNKCLLCGFTLWNPLRSDDDMASVTEPGRVRVPVCKLFYHRGMLMLT